MVMQNSGIRPDTVTTGMVIKTRALARAATEDFWRMRIAMRYSVPLKSEFRDNSKPLLRTETVGILKWEEVTTGLRLITQGLSMRIVS